MSVEAHFHPNSHVIKQNCKICSNQNPKITDDNCDGFFDNNEHVAVNMNDILYRTIVENILRIIQNYGSNKMDKHFTQLVKL